MKGGDFHETIESTIVQMLEMLVAAVGVDSEVKIFEEMFARVKERKKQMDNLLAKELKNISKVWKKTKPQTGFVRLDDGEYIAKIVKMSVGKSQGQSKRLQVSTVFKVMDGPEKGKEVTRFDGLDENGIGFFKGYAEVLGLELPDDISDLPEALEEFVDECTDLFNIQLRTKGEYQNLFVKGVSEFEEGEEEEDEEEEGEEEESEEEEDEEEEEENEEEEEEPEPVKKKKKKPASSTSKKKKRK